MKRSTVILALVTAVAVPFAAGTPVATVRYSDMCDASAAVALPGNRFVVANDEDNWLRVYQGTAGTTPQSTGAVDKLDLTRFLDLAKKKPEADIEGAAVIGSRIYWITSHGESAMGEPRPNRLRLFATQIETDGSGVRLKPVGKAFNGLVGALADDDDAAGLKGYQLDVAATDAPESATGLNIEGLTGTPDGALLIGFRNPVPGGKALLVPLENPQGVVDKAEKPRLGKAVLLDLGGSGIRSIEYSHQRKVYFIVAGPIGDRGDWHLYQWSGAATDPPVVVPGIDFTGLRPEALILDPEAPDRIQVLSDDGAEQVNGKDCKDLSKNPEKQGFRSTWFNL